MIQLNFTRKLGYGLSLYLRTQTGIVHNVKRYPEVILCHIGLKILKQIVASSLL